MKTNINLILTFITLMVSMVAFSQQTISGSVTDENGVPLPGATVFVQGTSNATTADFDGNFTINATIGDTIEASYVGYNSNSQTVTSATLNFVLSQSTELDEVIITAQGVARKEKALGYAVTTITSEDIENKPETDISKILTGKIPGVQINTGGGFLGTNANVIIRSKNSISGSNQPLYVVDGAPITGNRSFDLDPNNIASTTVLKGLAASALYGQDGRNGVIVITTKTGSGLAKSKGFEVEVSHTTSFLEVANLPEFQNLYGQGADNTINTTYFGTWGARFSGQEVPHHLSIPAYANSFPEYQGATDIYRAHPNNVNDFFDVGVGNTTSVLISNSTENNSVNFSYSKSDQVGYVEENRLVRDNFSFGSRTTLSNKLSLNTSVLYSKTIDTRPTRNFFTLLTWIPRNLDIHNLPYQDPNDGSSVYYRVTYSNPRWQQANSQFKEDSDRLFIKTQLDYDLNDNISLSYLYSNDYYNELNRDYQNKGGADSPLGYMNTFDDKDRITTHRASININNLELTDDWNLTGVAGFESKNQTANIIGLQSEDQVVFNFLNHNNFRETSALDSTSSLNTIGVYSQLEFDYNDFVFLTLTARNDWASTVAEENRSIFYPSASLSYILSDTPGFDSNGNYYKLRASYGTSANFPSPYLINPTLDAAPNAWINPFNGSVVSYNGLSSYLPNPGLLPELLKEVEFGIETKLFDNLVDLDISVYKRIVEDQILSSSLPTSTGYSSTTINAGRIDTDGIESALTLNLIRPTTSDGLAWSMTTNFTAYETTVKELPVDRVAFGDGVNHAIEGEPYGVFRGTFAMKDDDGNLLIHPDTGKIIFSDDVGAEDDLIGDPNEDFYLTNINTISYRNLTFGIQWEYIHGGDIYSLSASNLLRRGVTRDTEDREGSYIIPGVIGDPSTGEVVFDANGDKIKNNIQIGANDLYFINLMDVDENIVFDASVFRIRDISLTYSLPEDLLQNTPFGSAVFSAQANNFYYNAPNLPQYMNLDPEVLGANPEGSTNTKGVDYQNDPSYKQFSLGVKLTF
jgi:TonB-linked SusC/RagA family outer membrane protein